MVNVSQTTANDNAVPSPGITVCNKTKHQESFKDSSAFAHKKDIILEREKTFIFKRRRQLRITNPCECYFYRHAPIKYTHLFIQSFCMFVSLSLIFANYFFLSRQTMVGLPGVGKMSELTLVDYFGMTFLSLFSIRQLLKLYQAKGLNYSKRYKLSMLANAVNYFCFNSIIILIITVLLFLTTLGLSHVLGTGNVDEIKEMFNNGVLADMLNLALNFFAIIMLIRATRFFNKRDIT